MYRLTASGTEEWTFYGGYGEKLGVFQYSTSAGLYPVRSNVQFAGRTIIDDNFPVSQDRVGTNRANRARFMPFGDEITSTSNDREKFATYTRDSYTGLDYADQRFYASTYGRFNTPDPFRRSALRRNPESWNRYIYANDDPINKSDPTGRTCVDRSGSWADNGDGFGCPYASTTVSDWGSVNPNASGTTQVTSRVTYPPCPEPCGDNPLSATGAAIVQATGQLLNSISVGVVFFAPIAQTQVGPVHGEGLGVAQYDSNSGYSTAVLGETAVSVEEVSGAVGVEQNTTTGATDTLFFASVGNSSTGEVGAMASYQSGTFGFFAGIGGWGVGGYISLGGAGGAGGSGGGGNPS